MFHLSFKRKKRKDQVKEPRPLGLTAAQVQSLKALEAAPDFSVYKEALNVLADTHARSVLNNELDLAKTAYLRGLVRGLQDAADLCETVVTKTEEFNEYAGRKSKRGPDNKSTYWGNPLFWPNDRPGTSQRIDKS